jgi:hypothetical protein
VVTVAGRTEGALPTDVEGDASGASLALSMGEREETDSENSVKVHEPGQSTKPMQLLHNGICTNKSPS